MPAVAAPIMPLTNADLCDRCGAAAQIRVVLPDDGELLFCAHHAREHRDALSKVAIEIQDNSGRLIPK